MKIVLLLIVMGCLSACQTFEKEDLSHMWWLGHDVTNKKEKNDCFCDIEFDDCFEEYCKEKD